ncbi:MAG: SpoIIE family protein phosphatase, partial [Victivallales bacterium]
KRRASLWIKLITALIVTSAVALWEFTERNVLFESAARAGCVFSILPMFTLLFSFNTRNSKIMREISALAWIYAAVKAASVFTYGAFSPCLAVGGFLTLYYAREGAFFGGMCGFAAGMAAGIVYMPVLGIAGLAYGIFCDDMRKFALFFAASLSVSSGVYLASLSGAFPEFLCIVAGFAVFGIISGKLRPVIKESIRKKDRTVTLKKMSAAFSSLSEAFYVDNPPPPSKAEIAATLKSTVFALCDRCEFRGSKCRLDKYDLINHLTEVACGTEDALPNHVMQSCPKADLLTGRALSLASSKQSEGEKEAKLLTDGYNSIARLLCAAGEKAEAENVTNRDLSRRAADVLKKLGIPFSFVAVRGTRLMLLSAYGAEMPKIKVSGVEIRDRLSAALGISFSLPEFVNRENGCEMVLKALPAIKLEYAKAEASKAGEPVSGDTVVTFESDALMFYSLLADGMGSGREASVSSRLAALFMEKLITAGGDKKEALSMLNKLLLVRKNEVYTTVDLLEIDRLSGCASLIKAGAAPTYLCRDGKCYKLESSTPPAGVIDDLKVTQTSLMIKKGDWLVMVSDGVLPHNASLSLPKDKRTASAYASAILEERREAACRDDMSVCVIRAF